MSQTLCLFCCRHFKCENHFSWHHCLWLHKTQRRPSSGLYQTDCEQTKLPKMIYLLVFRRWMEPKYIRPDCQLRPKKVYFSIRHNAVNGSLRTFEPSQNNLIHWPNSIHNPFAYANREAPTEHIKSRMSNKQTTTTTHTHNRKTIPELHCILTARRRICTHQTAASRNIIPTHIRLIGSFNLSTDFRHLIQVTAGIAVATNVSVDIIFIWFHKYGLRSVSHCWLERNECAQTSRHFNRRGMKGQTFSLNPRKRGKRYQTEACH